MSARRSRYVLLAAFAISLLLHLLLAGYIRWPFRNPSSETEIVKVRRITIARIAPRTPAPTPPATPPPTPPPTPAPAARHTPAARRAKVVPPSIAPHSGKAPRVGHAVAPAAGTASAAPASTPAPAPAATAAPQPCLDHDISPAVSATGAPVPIPPDARASKASGVAAISVQIDPQGRITSASVARSSGSAGLDEVALQMARGATYTPALVKCKPVASNYTYTVKFVAW